MKILTLTLIFLPLSLTLMSTLFLQIRHLKRSDPTLLPAVFSPSLVMADLRNY